MFKHTFLIHSGCIENLYLNHTNVIASFKDKLGIYDKDQYINYEKIGDITDTCQRDALTIPVTFRLVSGDIKSSDP